MLFDQSNLYLYLYVDFPFYVLLTSFSKDLLAIHLAVLQNDNVVEIMQASLTSYEIQFQSCRRPWPKMAL